MMALEGVYSQLDSDQALLVLIKQLEVDKTCSCPAACESVDNFFPFEYTRMPTEYKPVPVQTNPVADLPDGMHWHCQWQLFTATNDNRDRVELRNNNLRTAVGNLLAAETAR